MAKRGAASELNHDNWDQEEEPEVAGTFQKASNEAMQRRVLKVAKRRSTGQADQGLSRNVFSGFPGFKADGSGTIKSNSDLKSTFSFLSNNSVTSPASNGVQNQSQASSNISAISSSSAFTNTNALGQSSSKNESDSGANFKKYLAKLIRLNQCVVDWIKSHVDKDPVCILTPVFRDYERYLKEIEEENNISTTEKEDFKDSDNSGSKNNLVSAINVAASNFQFNQTSDSKSGTAASNLDNITKLPSSTSLEESGSNTTSMHSMFSSFKSDSINKAGGVTTLLAKPDPASLMINPFFSKPNQDTAVISESKNTTGSDKSQQITPTTSAVSFGSVSILPFNKTDSVVGSSPSGESSKNNKTADGEPNDDDEPPKAEFKPIKEEDAIYSKRCKVFIKKDAKNYGDLGIGTLFVKPIKDAGKHQLIVRADTSLGNVLVNVILNSAIPMQRLGKNNVMIICVPTPPPAGSNSPQTPSTVLLRVKTSEEADELLEVLEKFKKL